MTFPLLSGRAHVDALLEVLPLLDVGRLDAWGRELAVVLSGGGRLLVAGNGGSAAQAQHLTAELVGRYRDERPALSALCLSAETSSLTALSNDYGWEAAYARQVAAHGRPGDVLLAMSTSGRSANIVSAMVSARAAGLSVWALTGPAGSPVGGAADSCLAVEAPATATVQEVHQVAVHLICAALDLALGAGHDSEVLIGLRA